MYIDNFIGTRLAEYEVFVQYYRSLISLLMTRSLFSELLMTGSRSRRPFTYELYSCIVTNHYWIDMGLLSDTELLLAIIAMELHCGRTSSFNKMLDCLIYSEYDPHLDLAMEMKQQVEIFDPHKSSGMYASMHIIAIIHSLT